MSFKDEIIKDIESRIDSWKNDRKKIGNDEYDNYLHGKNIDYSICDIVIQELLDLLNDVKGRNQE